MTSRRKAPSQARLERLLALTPDQAATVRGLIQGLVEPESIAATEQWVRRCLHRPHEGELVMHAINEVIGMHGVEGVGPVSRKRDAAADYAPAYDYCNTGDPYALTILRNNERGSFFIGCWATYAEEGP